jgi:hypothetical protein
LAMEFRRKIRSTLETFRPSMPKMTKNCRK